MRSSCRQRCQHGLVEGKGERTRRGGALSLWMCALANDIVLSTNRRWFPAPTNFVDARRSLSIPQTSSSTSTTTPDTQRSEQLARRRAHVGPGTAPQRHSSFLRPAQRPTSHCQSLIYTYSCPCATLSSTCTIMAATNITANTYPTYGLPSFLKTSNLISLSVKGGRNKQVRGSCRRGSQ